jgi:hypothetical protein
LEFHPPSRPRLFEVGAEEEGATEAEVEVEREVEEEARMCSVLGWERRWEGRTQMPEALEVGKRRMRVNREVRGEVGGGDVEAAPVLGVPVVSA